MEEHPVILFDGVCNYCNAIVNWVMDADNKNRFRFALLQSPYGQKILRQNGLPADFLDSFIFYKNGKAYLRSEAALLVMKELGGIYALAYVFILVPRFISDGLYNFIARYRYRWFGKKDQCRIPTVEEASKFISA